MFGESDELYFRSSVCRSATHEFTKATEFYLLLAIALYECYNRMLDGGEFVWQSVDKADLAAERSNLPQTHYDRRSEPHCDAGWHEHARAG